ncbi:Phosphoglycolate phosphatase, HAD superfamily [Paenibacillus sp. yr247]|uniref:HAD family hydrolase n=1 Tax=Paenibacillus sp. yr247 TaxID=1761880 RepID=UPI0008817BDD|nr:HAD hydrolase-like protein [Paenibacillus sp. yr247]SDN22050.1 Phosphoglycolate phosphatase, HAD superfamily [Paenibacillus sp. yr247]
MSSQRSQPEAMLFDLDGTLFQTETLLLPAYHATFDELRAKDLFTGETPPEDRILGALGMLLEHIWMRVIPDASIDTRQEADKLLLRYQMEGLQQGQGVLYEGVAETLQVLRDKGIRLFVASNGLEDYVRHVIEAKGLGHLFEGLYSAGQYQTRSKVDLVKILLETHQIQSAWMVGDRSSDVEAGLQNSLTVAACDYAGFRESGELEGAHIRIRNFTELLEYV